jgi:dihydrofolate reductase
MGVTLDGYVAGTGGEGDWGLPAEHPDVRACKLASLRQVGTHIMGRVTYQQMAGHWPTAAGDYAAFMNKLPKVVFSQTLPAAGWAGSRIARGDLAVEIAALKSGSGGEIIMAHGGAAFVQALSRLGLIDEYRLVIVPVALDGGKVWKFLPAASCRSSSSCRSSGMAELSASGRTCQVPLALASSIRAWPCSVIRPSPVIFAARCRFTRLHVLRGLRGVNRR